MSHIHEKVDFTAGAFIVHKNKVLLRMHEKHGIWLEPGGHVELDEDPSETAVREAKEEVGLDIVLAGGDSEIERTGFRHQTVVDTPLHATPSC